MLWRHEGVSRWLFEILPHASAGEGAQTGDFRCEVQRTELTGGHFGLASAAKIVEQRCFQLTGSADHRVSPARLGERRNFSMLKVACPYAHLL